MASVVTSLSNKKRKDKMKQLTSAQVRQMWLDFWKSKGHSVEPSANLVPVNDPTLLWINSGVATLKKYFDGSVIPENPRITNAQKAIRTNDIENVGKTARHHTMFEMLGNFSVGDYFRDEAITWGFELLTSPEWFDFPKDKLYMTYYPDDKDTYNRWISLGVEPSHLIPIEDNFWEIGAGPSGPDTEIFFDRGEDFDPDHVGIKLLAEDIENDRYIEIWNIVLSQFNADPAVPSTKNCHTKTLIRVPVWNVWLRLCKGLKQTLKLTSSCQSFVKSKNYLVKLMIQMATT